jgi:hypothetical protein
MDGVLESCLPYTEGRWLEHSFSGFEPEGSCASNTNPPGSYLATPLVKGGKSNTDLDLTP